MAIKKFQDGDVAGRFINEPGEFLVKVIETKSGISKSQMQMLTVTFSTQDKKLIRAYFLTKKPWSMERFTKLKIACGLDPKTSTADDLIGMKCGIAVDKSDQLKEDGSPFMEITGYGSMEDLSSSDIGRSDFAKPLTPEEIPF